LFPHPAASAPQPEKPKPAPRILRVVEAAERGKSVKQTNSSGRDSFPESNCCAGRPGFSVPSTLQSASSSATESHAPAPTRPYIPPLEDSFEQAWERGNLTSPSDSPHLSRAAAAAADSIIAIALAVIVGALVYNFRQDIGGIVIQLGQSISGENRPAVPRQHWKQNQSSRRQTGRAKRKRRSLPVRSPVVRRHRTHQRNQQTPRIRPRVQRIQIPQQALKRVQRRVRKQVRRPPASRGIPVELVLGKLFRWLRIRRKIPRRKLRSIQERKAEQRRIPLSGRKNSWD
jgi:hypothetical protein